MLQTKYIIKMKIPTRPDLDYFYMGQNSEGCAVFDHRKYRKPDVKRYDYFEEADRDRRTLAAIHDNKSDQFKVITVRCRT